MTGSWQRRSARSGRETRFDRAVAFSRAVGGDVVGVVAVRWRRSPPGLLRRFSFGGAGGDHLGQDAAHRLDQQRLVPSRAGAFMQADPRSQHPQNGQRGVPSTGRDEHHRLLSTMVEVGLCDSAADPGEVARPPESPCYAADEIRAALAWTRSAADRELGFAETLVLRMPAVLATLEAGRMPEQSVAVRGSVR